MHSTNLKQLIHRFPWLNFGKFRTTVFPLLLLTALFVSHIIEIKAVVAKERSEIPEELKWDLTPLYPNRQAWEKAKNELKASLPKLSAYKGSLGKSAHNLYQAFSSILQARKTLDRLYSYAMFLHDQDTRVSKNQEMVQSISQVAVELDAATSFFKPEIIALGKDKVLRLVDSHPGLKKYRHIFEDILRQSSHTVSPQEEKIFALAGELMEAGESIHSIFTNADMPYPTVTLTDGTRVRLDAAGYTKYRALPNRQDRIKVFKAFWGRYQDFKRTLGTALYNEVKAHIFNKQVHNYKSCLEASLFPENIPTEVYHRLIADVHRNLPTLHRYLKLKKQLLGVKQLGYEDLYAPIVPKANLHFTPRQAMDITVKALAPLGSDYQAIIKRIYRERWVDFMPTTGKRSGAYSEGAAYDVHPYELLNFMGNYLDLSTLAHEDGHTVHSYLSNTHQPYGLHDYSIFVAEVASTLNENLLLHYMLDHTKDKETKLALLGNYLENLRQTLFRQVLFAEFELAIHEKAEHGETLTGDNLNQLYLKLLRTYYGHDKGICYIDDLYAVEWAYIPHFYYNFYVYQYATSLIASTSIAHKILDEYKHGNKSTKWRDAYLTMLSSGSSDYPIELLRRAGVDMTTSKPFDDAIKEMNHIMDEIETLTQNKR